MNTYTALLDSNKGDILKAVIPTEGDAEDAYRLLQLQNLRIIKVQMSSREDLVRALCTSKKVTNPLGYMLLI